MKYITFYMKNNNNYKYLLENLTALKGVGKKTTHVLKKKKLTTYLICSGDCPNLIQIGPQLAKLTNFKLEKFIQ